jgi:antitoxin component HigA of HigAB toxin-antitoxin module
LDAEEQYTNMHINALNKVYARARAGNISAAEVMDFSTADSEGVVLLDSIMDALNSTLNDVWYSPSQGGTFSNFLSW